MGGGWGSERQSKIEREESGRESEHRSELRLQKEKKVVVREVDFKS